MHPTTMNFAIEVFSTLRTNYISNLIGNSLVVSQVQSIFINFCVTTITMRPGCLHTTRVTRKRPIYAATFCKALLDIFEMMYLTTANAKAFSFPKHVPIRFNLNRIREGSLQLHSNQALQVALWIVFTTSWCQINRTLSMVILKIFTIIAILTPR